MISEFPELSETEFDTKISLADSTFHSWRRKSLQERTEVFRNMGVFLKRNSDSLAELITSEMGKPLKEAKSEVEKCASTAMYFSDQAESMLKPQYTGAESRKSYVSFQPTGVIFGIMPWNYPFWQVFRFAIPSLLAGNTVVVKHSPNTWGCGEKIEDLFREVGCPEGVFQNLRIDIPAAESLIADRRITGVSLTGSTRAGRRIGGLAGQNLKKCVLELGGSDPYIVLDDADIDLAAKICVQGRMINGGQSCVAAKRWIVTSKNYDDFQGKVLNLLKAKVMGDPANPKTDLGPMARLDLRDQLHNQVLKSTKQGSHLLLGGEVPALPGYYYPASLLVDVKADHAAFQEEIFGPVGVLIRARDEEEAIQLANQTDYGLGGAIFTRDLEKAELLAREEVFAGQVFVNDFVKSDARMPFGGIKDSGLGRELSQFGIREFTNVKTIVVS